MSAVREVIVENLPAGYREGIGKGMISYTVPLERYPDTYNGEALMYAALANQKNYMSVYLMCIYGDADLTNWFQDAYRATGKRLDMGKSCVRFRRLEDLPLELVGQAIARVDPGEYIKMYERSRSR
jgi:hypothetical protein